MKKIFISSALALLLLASCNKDKEILNTLNDYNIGKQDQGYHFGDKIQIPEDVMDYAEAITITYNDKETDKLNIDPSFFSLGENDITFNIKTKSGEVLQQDATINVFAKTAPKKLNYEIVNQFPHDTDHFTEGFEAHGNIIYESVGLEGKSKIIKYNLGSTQPIQEVPQNNEFSEGLTVFGDKIYQLTYKSKKGFIYDSNIKLIKEFTYPEVIAEGWGMTNDGKNLIVSDGTKFIYFLNPDNPSQIVRSIAVASNTEGYDQINELEYHNGSIYANVWHKPIILKIAPDTGEVRAILDFSELISKQNLSDSESVLNGIAFKGENMLVTGKNWSKIYEVILK